jgi:hypothetical protein
MPSKVVKDANSHHKHFCFVCVVKLIAWALHTCSKSLDHNWNNLVDIQKREKKLNEVLREQNFYVTGPLQSNLVAFYR